MSGAAIMPVFNYYHHQLMWNYLAEHPFAKKRDWPGWVELYGAPIYGEYYHCFACHFDAAKRAVINKDKSAVCTCCPLIWPCMATKRKHPCLAKGSPFKAWVKAMLTPASEESRQVVVDSAKKMRDLELNFPALSGCAVQIESGITY